MSHFFPLAAGNRWTYRVTGRPRVQRLSVKLESPEIIEPTVTIHREPTPISAWPTSASWHPGDQVRAFLQEIDGGVRVLRTTWVGPRGTPIIAVDDEYRWEGPETWTFEHRGGCSVHEVEARRKEAEDVRTPAGNFHALSMDFRRGDTRWTVWIAPGVGLVRRIDEDDPRVLLELEKFALK